MYFPVTFLNATIIKNNDGIVIVKNGCNAMPGAMCYRTGTDEECVERAKKDIIRLFMIENPTIYEASIYYRMTGRGGAYFEWGTMKDHLQKIGIPIPEGLNRDNSGNMLIAYNGEAI